MTTTLKFDAAKREGSGKSGARALRREGRIPAIVYGRGKEPVQVALDATKLTREYLKPGFFSHLVDLDLGKETLRVITRSVQTHPVTDALEHADFQFVDKHTRVRVWIPVHFLNQDKSPGIKRGGVLNIVRREVEFSCQPESIPEHIEVDMDGKEIGDSIHISHIKLPQGITPVISDRDFTVATVVGRGKEEEIPTGAPEAAPMPGAEGEAAAQDAKAGDAKKAEAPKKEGK